MKVKQDPEPFPANASYDLTASGGTPPYTFVAEPSPPNPPGVQVSTSGSTATVTVPESTPGGTQIGILVKDSSDPPKEEIKVNHVL